MEHGLALIMALFPIFFGIASFAENAVLSVLGIIAGVFLVFFS